MSTKQPTTIQLFISTDDEACTAVKDYLETWVKQQVEASLEVISILDNPQQLIRAGINHTPALVVNGEVVSQQCSVEEVKALLGNTSE